MACEICGSLEDLSTYLIEGEDVIRCDRHAVGIPKAAEEIYRRRSASSNESKPKQQTEDEV